MDNVFYQIPEIYALHHRFLQQISARVEQWHSLEQIGDIFVDNVSVGSRTERRRERGGGGEV